MLRLAAILLLATSTLLAQDCLTRKLLINVSDDQLRRVTAGLTAENFSGTFHGKAVEVVDLRPIQSESRVVLLVDVSASMKKSNFGTDNRVLAPVVHSIFVAMPKDVPVSVGTFDTELRELTEFSRDYQALEATLGATTRGFQNFKKRTAIVDAMDVVLQKFGSPQPTDALILLTDGEDNQTHDWKKKMQHLIASQTRTFMVLFQDPPHQPFPQGVLVMTDEQFNRETLVTLVEKTGGALFRLNRELDPADPKVQWTVQEVTRRITSRVDKGWELTIRLPETSKKSDKLNLKLAGLAEKQLKRFHLEYPQYVQPCSATSSNASTQP